MLLLQSDYDSSTPKNFILLVEYWCIIINIMMFSFHREFLIFCVLLMMGYKLNRIQENIEPLLMSEYQIIFLLTNNMFSYVSHRIYKDFCYLDLNKYMKVENTQNNNRNSLTKRIAQKNTFVQRSRDLIS